MQITARPPPPRGLQSSTSRALGFPGSVLVPPSQGHLVAKIILTVTVTVTVTVAILPKSRAAVSMTVAVTVTVPAAISVTVAVCVALTVTVDACGPGKVVVMVVKRIAPGHHLVQDLGFRV